MDIILANIEHLQNYCNEQKKPVKRVVVDFKQVVDQSFTQLFFDACKKYDEENPQGVIFYENEPRYCDAEDLKTATEHMKSEFDVIRKDARIFMENKNIKPKFRVEHKMIGSNEVKKVLICPFCDTKYDDLFGTSKIYNGSWTKCNFCGNDVYIPEEV